MKRPNALHPDVWKPYITACYQAGINPEKGKRPSGGIGARIMQLIGTAKASAGFHASDGTYTDKNGKKYNYCAAIDIRTTDLTTEEAERLNRCLIKNGFASWWRNSGSFKNNQHIHCVYAGVPMKKQLRAQLHSFLDRKSGLVGNRPEAFLQSLSNMSEAAEQKVRTLFLSKNRMFGASFDDKSYEEELPLECGCEHLEQDSEGVWGDIDDDVESLHEEE